MFGHRNECSPEVESAVEFTVLFATGHDDPFVCVRTKSRGFL